MRSQTCLKSSHHRPNVGLLGLSQSADSAVTSLCIDVEVPNKVWLGTGTGKRCRSRVYRVFDLPRSACLSVRPQS